MSRREIKETPMNMSSMIDIVFLLIIFFVVTAAVDKEVHDEAIVLAASPHGKPVEKMPKNAFYVNVRADGTVTLDGTPVTTEELTKALLPYRRDDLPIIIRGDYEARHGHIMKVEKAITETGMFKVRFNAAQKPANDVPRAKQKKGGR